MAAMDRRVFLASSRSRTVSSDAMTAAMPPGGNAWMRRPRSETRASASSSESIPATQAAVSSPTLWPDHRIRYDTAGEPELGEGVLQSEERGLRVPRLVEKRIRGDGGEHHLEERTIEPGVEERRAAIESLAEDGMRAMKSHTH